MSANSSQENNHEFCTSLWKCLSAAHQARAGVDAVAASHAGLRGPDLVQRRKGTAIALPATHPITGRSRDNLPNPVASNEDPYAPLNGPAISDLFDMFDFGHEHDD